MHTNAFWACIVGIDEASVVNGFASLMNAYKVYVVYSLKQLVGGKKNCNHTTQCQAIKTEAAHHMDA